MHFKEFARAFARMFVGYQLIYLRSKTKQRKYPINLKLCKKMTPGLKLLSNAIRKRLIQFNNDAFQLN